METKENDPIIKTPSMPPVYQLGLAEKKAKELGYVYQEKKKKGEKNYSSLKYTTAKASIERALMELAVVKPFDEIKVSDIVEISGVNKTTIYRDYTDEAAKENGLFLNFVPAWRYHERATQDQSYAKNILAFCLQRFVENFIYENHMDLVTPKQVFNAISVITSIHTHANYDSLADFQKEFAELMVGYFIKCILSMSMHQDGSYMNIIMQKANTPSGVYELHYEVCYTLVLTWMNNGRNINIMHEAANIYHDITLMTDVSHAVQSRETAEEDLRFKKIMKSKTGINTEKLEFLFPLDQKNNHSQIPLSKRSKEIETALMCLILSGMDKVTEADIHKLLPDLDEGSIRYPYSDQACIKCDIFRYLPMEFFYEDDFEIKNKGKDDSVKKRKVFDRKVMCFIIIRFLDNYIYDKKLSFMYPKDWLKIVSEFHKEHEYFLPMLNECLAPDVMNRVISVIVNYFLRKSYSERYSSILMLKSRDPEFINDFHVEMLTQNITIWLRSNCAYPLPGMANMVFQDLIVIINKAIDTMFTKRIMYDGRIRLTYNHKYDDFDKAVNTYADYSSIADNGSEENKELVIDNPDGELPLFKLFKDAKGASEIEASKTKDAIEKAVLRLCAEKDPDTIQVKEIEAMSGKPKTTIYRNYAGDKYTTTGFYQVSVRLGLDKSDNVIYNIIDMAVQRYIDNIIYMYKLPTEKPEDWLIIFRVAFHSFNSGIDYVFSHAKRTFIERIIKLTAGYLVKLSEKQPYMQDLLEVSSSSSFTVIFHQVTLYRIFMKWVNYQLVAQDLGELSANIFSDILLILFVNAENVLKKNPEYFTIPEPGKGKSQDRYNAYKEFRELLDQDKTLVQFIDDNLSIDEQ